MKVAEYRSLYNMFQSIMFLGVLPFKNLRQMTSSRQKCLNEMINIKNKTSKMLCETESMALNICKRCLIHNKYPKSKKAKRNPGLFVLHGGGVSYSVPRLSQVVPKQMVLL